MLSHTAKSFKRAWIQHTGLQFATLTILVASFTAIISFSSICMNLKSMLSVWGDSIQMTAYLEDEVNEKQIADLKEGIIALEQVETIKYLSKDDAAALFKKEMSTYLPEVIHDKSFPNPFPSSLEIFFKTKFKNALDSQQLSRMARNISSLRGVDEVSYGQEWLENYASLVRGVNQMGLGLILIMICGAIFVIGNSIKTSIFQRRDEIEILELVGATQSFIRKPYIFEGAAMGFLASAFSLAISYGLFLLAQRAIEKNLAFLALTSQIKHMTPIYYVAALVGGTVVGALSAYLFIRRLNHGWLASQRGEA